MASVYFYYIPVFGITLAVIISLATAAPRQAISDGEILKLAKLR